MIISNNLTYYEKIPFFIFHRIYSKEIKNNFFFNKILKFLSLQFKIEYFQFGTKVVFIVNNYKFKSFFFILNLYKLYIPIIKIIYYFLKVKIFLSLPYSEKKTHLEFILFPITKMYQKVILFHFIHKLKNLNVFIFSFPNKDPSFYKKMIISKELLLLENFLIPIPFVYGTIYFDDYTNGFFISLPQKFKHLQINQTLYKSKFKKRNIESITKLTFLDNIYKNIEMLNLFFLIGDEFIFYRLSIEFVANHIGFIKNLSNNKEYLMIKIKKISIQKIKKIHYAKCFFRNIKDETN